VLLDLVAQQAVQAHEGLMDSQVHLGNKVLPDLLVNLVLLDHREE